VALLAETDHLHDTLSGPATKVLLIRACAAFGDSRFARLSQVPVSPLYNLRASDLYGKYPINAADIATQWELVASVERISEAYLLPVIALLLDGFPFAIRGFHSGSGSGYVNHKTAELLGKLRVESTKSRPRQTNDTARAERKNGAIVRKTMGYSHIPQKHAAAINRFHSEAPNPYLNFHRPCYFAVDTINATGKIRKTYPHDQIMTPWQRLKSIPDYDNYPKPGITPHHLKHSCSLFQVGVRSSRDFYTSEFPIFTTVVVYFR